MGSLVGDELSFLKLGSVLVDFSSIAALRSTVNLPCRPELKWSHDKSTCVKFSLIFCVCELTMW